MQIENQINLDITQNMRVTNTIKLEALRTIKTAIQIEQAKDGKELSDEDVIKIIQKLVSQRTDSTSQYLIANRLDLANHEKELIDIFKTYLPIQLSEEELGIKAQKYIDIVGATNIRDMGKVMEIANKQLVGTADMKLFGTIVKKLLT